MVAYIIFFREGPVRDPAAMAEYSKTATEASKGFNLKPLVVYGAQEACEGTPPEGVVMLEFPTMDEAKAWYNSPIYQSAAPYRRKAADYRAVFVEGWTPPG